MKFFIKNENYKNEKFYYFDRDNVGFFHERLGGQQKPTGSRSYRAYNNKLIHLSLSVE